jgi:hypothetical protein
MRLRLDVSIFLLVGSVVQGTAMSAPANAPTSPTSQTAKANHDDAELKPNSKAWNEIRANVLDELKSGDASKAIDAYNTLLDAEKRMKQHQERPFLLLSAVKRYDLAERMAVDCILRNPGNSDFVESAERARSQAFLAEHRFAEALSAAKSYYNVARLKDSSDAINLVSQCLALGKPDDPTAAKRFKRQQIAWASADPSSQPSSAATQPSAALGDPVLPGIQADSKPFEAAAAASQLFEYPDFVASGNLLLLCGKAKEARDIFQRAEGLAPDNKGAEAIENVARAIRAEAGCVGPANAYILAARAEQQ